MSQPEISKSVKSTMKKEPDAEGMYDYILWRGVAGAGLGLGTVGALNMLATRRFQWWNRGNLFARTFLLFGGSAVGFTIAAEFAMIHYARFIDRAEISGFEALRKQDEEKVRLRSVKQSFWQNSLDLAWDNRFKMIAGAWASTLALSLLKDSSKLQTNGVARFGHARITAQFVTLIAVVAAFAFDSERGPFAEKYQHNNDDFGSRKSGGTS